MLVVPLLVAEVHSLSLDARANNVDADLLRSDHMRILEFLVKDSLEFVLERVHWGESSRSKNDRPGAQLLNLLEPDPRIETPEVQHLLPVVLSHST